MNIFSDLVLILTSSELATLDYSLISAYLSATLYALNGFTTPLSASNTSYTKYTE